MHTSAHESFKALGDPNRLRVLVLLLETELCVCDIAAALALPQPTISRHISQLKIAGLVTDRRDGRWIHYRLTDSEPLTSLRSYLDSLSRQEPFQKDRSQLRHTREDQLPAQETITDSTCILALCTGNSCRSQMAEAFFRHKLDRMGLSTAAMAVRSAGLEPHGVNPNAVEAMAEVGIDISSHTSDDLRQYMREKFDFVITVCDNAAEKCPVFPGQGERLHWPFPDPAGGPMEQFRSVRDAIHEKIVSWLGNHERIRKKHQRN